MAAEGLPLGVFGDIYVGTIYFALLLQKSC